MSIVNEPAFLKIDDSCGISKSVLTGQSFKKLNLTAVSPDAAQPWKMFDQLASVLREEQAVVVAQDVLCVESCLNEGVRAFESVFGGAAWPVAWLRGTGEAGEVLPVTQLVAIAGAKVTPVRSGGRVIGGVYENEHAQYCLLGDVRPLDTTLSRPAQARQVLEQIEAALLNAGMDFSHVVRTWFYNDDILAWYDDFNAVRTGFFNERGVFDGLVPASTGVGIGNRAGAALTADVFALKANHDGVRVREVPSPLQCPAPDYASSFSRAVEVEIPDHRRLYISGTASINADGSTRHVGDIVRQVDFTMEVVHELLTSRGMDWTDINRAVAYLRDTRDLEVLSDYLEAKGVPPFPMAVAQSVICRDDLLFEIEVDATRV